MHKKAVLISIHPKYIELILSGEKRLEFRRSWAATPVSNLVIYGCAPVKRIVAVAEIKATIWGSRTKLWNIAKKQGGAITRRELLAYLNGKKIAVAIELFNVKSIVGGLDPKVLLGYEFRPPQSFMYIDNDTFSRIKCMTKY